MINSFQISNGENPVTEGEKQQQESSNQQGNSATTIVIPSGSAARQVLLFYQPSPTQVVSGSEVFWYNQDTTTHTATADDVSFDTGGISPDTSSSVILEGQGQIRYHCNIHPYMTGLIQLSDTAGATDGGGENGWVTAESI